jgi:hypothetical protein
MLERGRKKFWVGFGECVIASLVVPVLLLLPGQLNYLHVFDRRADRRGAGHVAGDAVSVPAAAARCPARTPEVPGLLRYAKQPVDQQFARWVMVHVQSKPLPICTRPRVSRARWTQRSPLSGSMPSTRPRVASRCRCG